jgi:hypothetical protein
MFVARIASACCLQLLKAHAHRVSIRIDACFIIEFNIDDWPCIFGVCSMGPATASTLIAQIIASVLSGTSSDCSACVLPGGDAQEPSPKHAASPSSQVLPRQSSQNDSSTSLRAARISLVPRGAKLLGLSIPAMSRCQRSFRVVPEPTTSVACEALFAIQSPAEYDCVWTVHGRNAPSSSCRSSQPQIPTHTDSACPVG